jgi:hypothetical protein
MRSSPPGPSEITDPIIKDFFEREEYVKILRKSANDSYEKLDKIQRALRDPVPNAPFKGDAWINLGLKRAITEAINTGRTHLAWADTEVLVDRWNDRYRQLYENLYNKKMVKFVKKLTGQTPTHHMFPGRNDLGYWIVPLADIKEEVKTEGFSLFQGGDHLTPGWRSGLRDFIAEHKQESGPPAQWKKMIDNAPGIKTEEVEWSGVKEWLDTRAEKVSRAEIVEYLDANGLEVEEVHLGMGGEQTYVPDPDNELLEFDVERWEEENSDRINEVEMDLIYDGFDADYEAPDWVTHYIPGDTFKSPEGGLCSPQDLQEELRRAYEQLEAPYLMRPDEASDDKMERKIAVLLQQIAEVEPIANMDTKTPDLFTGRPGPSDLLRTTSTLSWTTAATGLSMRRAANTTIGRTYG